MVNPPENKTSKKAAGFTENATIRLSTAVALTVLVVLVFLFRHLGQTGFDGLQLKSQSLTFIVGSIRAIFFARVVLPIPGGPKMTMCLFIRSADFTCALPICAN